MVSFKLLIQSRLVKGSLFLMALLFTSANFADTNSNAPLQLAALSDGFNAEQTYMQTCFACHNSGAAGSPKLTDAADWSARMAKGMDAVMTNVLNGLNAMPAKGLCFNCTDDDLRAVVQYMYDQSQK